MECRKITFVRLRNTEKYTGKPFEHIVDSMYQLIENFIQTNNDKYDFDSYNVSLPSIPKKQKNIRDIKSIIDSDVLVIPSENEFAYHIKGRMSNILLGRSWTRVQNIREALLDNPKPRKIILITSDKADTCELFEQRVFHDIPNLTFDRIDESEFPGGIHHLKFINLLDLKINKTKTKDFAYWGTSKKEKVDFTSEEIEVPIKDWYDIKTNKLTQKSNTKENYLKVRMNIQLLKGVSSKDERHTILDNINSDSDIVNNMIGYFDGFKYTHKFDKNMNKIFEYISECRATLCFNWPGQEEHLTSRYNEALGCDVIPLVWKNYDCNNQLVVDDWQRCYSFEDVKKKCLTLRDESIRLEKLNFIKEKYLEVTKPLSYYEKEFNKKLINKLEIK